MASWRDRAAHVGVTEGHPDKFCDHVSDAVVRQVFPLSPKRMIDHLKLRQSVYLKTATYAALDVRSLSGSV